jgi:hypothetical protein
MEIEENDTPFNNQWKWYDMVWYTGALQTEPILVVTIYNLRGGVETSFSLVTTYV